MLAAALLNYADDYGYFNANPKLIHGEIYPLREPSVSVPESLRRLQSIGYIRLGTGPCGRCYGHIVEFEKHQRVSHPTDSKISIISIVWGNSGTIPENFQNPPEVFGPEPGREQGTGNGKEQGNIAPAKAVAVRVEPDGFNKFYQAYPRRVGKADAERAYKKALSRASPETILGGACMAATAAIGQDEKFIPHPATWLNRDGWLDEHKPKMNGHANGTGKRTTTDQHLAGIADLASQLRAERGA
jgi:hypothetical protein